MNALEEHLLNGFEVPQDLGYEQAQQFRITDDQMANWALRKVKKIRADYAAAAELATVESSRITEWLDNQHEAAQRSEEFFISLLTAYYAPKHAEDPKAKTFKLPAGAVQFRAQQPAFTRDDNVLIDWLKQHDLADYIKTVESPEWGELKKELVVADGRAYLKETGEAVDGVTVEERPEIVRVEVS